MVLYPQATRAHSGEGGPRCRAPDGCDNTMGGFSFFYFCRPVAPQVILQKEIKSSFAGTLAF